MQAFLLPSENSDNIYSFHQYLTTFRWPKRAHHPVLSAHITLASSVYYQGLLWGLPTGLLEPPEGALILAASLRFTIFLTCIDHENNSSKNSRVPASVLIGLSVATVAVYYPPSPRPDIRCDSKERCWHLIMNTLWPVERDTSAGNDQF